MSAGLVAATAQATAVALAGPEHRARAIAMVVGGTTLAVAVGAPLGALVGAMWGWRGTFLALGILGILCATILWARLPRDLRGARLSLRTRLTAIARPGVAPALLVTLLYLTGAFVIIGYLAPLAIDGAGLDEYALPQMLLVFGIGAVIGNLGSGYLADRLGATRVVVLSLLSAIAMPIAIALGLMLLPQSLSGPLLIWIMLPWGIIGWSFPPAQASRIVGCAPDVAHLTLSLNASALYLGIALGTVVGGRTLEIGAPADLGLVAAIFPVLALAVLGAGSLRAARRSESVPVGSVVQSVPASRRS
jgi:predicted MFS family arabinose efflux permease